LQHAFPNDPEFQRSLAARSSKRRQSDYDKYIEIPNDPSIPSALVWWRDNHKLYPDMGKMARDVLAVPASGCAVERQFSVSGRMAIWQRNRLSPKIISDSMIYKSALAKTRRPLCSKLDIVDDIDILPIDEHEATVPEEWTQGWWLKKLGKNSIGENIIGMFQMNGYEEEDIYG